MNVTIDGVSFINVDAFDDALKSLLKSKVFSSKGYLLDLIEQDSVKGNPDGSNDFEVPSYETKSGHAELIGYSRKTELDEDGNLSNITVIF